MFIHNLEIENFRGIKKADITFPKDRNIICLIGSGDSTKSTILKAIEYVFSNSWNLSIYDNDFYDCKTDEPIAIRATFSGFPEKLLTEDKFGFYLRKLGVKYDETSNDDPEDGEDVGLTIQLSIDESLEPIWTIVKNNAEPKTISASDRKLLQVVSVGDNCSRDMMWSKYSVLQKYSDNRDVLRVEHNKVMRDVSAKANFEPLDTIAETVVEIGKLYGVGFNSIIKNRMTIQNNSITSIVGLYDGNSPLSQRGNGSQKLLSMGLNIKASKDNIVLLMDEIEIGLEPYRLRSLIGILRQNRRDGQVIMTTHSPVVVSECVIGELSVVVSNNGETSVIILKSDDKDVDNDMQAELRKNSEAFLSKRIIVCEGQTEKGFVRALDKYLQDKQDYRMACNGVDSAVGSGTNLFRCAKILILCSYDVCIFMDSDDPNQEIKKKNFIEEGCALFDWEKDNSIEEQIFNDVPNDVVSKLLNAAVELNNLDQISSNLKDQVDYNIVEDKIVLNDINDTIKKELGKIAKKKEWYKNITKGEKLGDIIFNNWESIPPDSRLYIVVNNMIDWIKNEQ